MENQLRCVMFNREEFLIEHQLDADVLFFIRGTVSIWGAGFKS